MPPPNAVAASEDDTPIGPKLTAIAFLGPKDELVKKPETGVDTRDLPILSNPRFTARLTPFLGRLISRKLIAEIEAAVVTWYREQNRPFISVSTPPQEITSGALQFRVIEFRAGNITVSGAKRAAPATIKSQVRLAPQDAIDSAHLSEDLDWLNRSPFRQVEAVFGPGKAVGETDLELRVTEQKPWQAFAGYSNSGSSQTGWDRYSAGLTIGDLPVTNAVLSYQLTGSSDFWYDDGTLFGNAADPRYVSHSGRFLVPTGGRQDLEGTVSFVETNAATDPFTAREKILEGAVGYRIALSNLGPLAGEAIDGIEVKRETRETLFGNTAVDEASAEVYQLYAGWANHWSDARGRTDIETTLHFSPGGLTNANSSDALGAFSKGRVTNATYAYADLTLDRLINLGKGLSLHAALSAQTATGALPDTEQLAVGGSSAVRAYTSDDGSYDFAVISRNEFHLPTMDTPQAKKTLIALSPFAFLDAGYGSDVHGPGVTLASTGVGADFAFGSHATASVTAGCALIKAVSTKTGDCRVGFNLVGSY